MKPTLLVLAAGMGSRYGGLKQIDPVGPNGEIILDYSIFDAIRAGFGKVVFVIRHDIEEEFRSLVSKRWEDKIQVEYAFQQLDALPAPFTVPEGRVKPWGTGHAILSAADLINEPFSAINADDFYGKSAYALIGKALSEDTDPAMHYMVGYPLKKTLSEFGTVARGICNTENGILTEVVERTKIASTGNGTARFDDGEGTVIDFTGDEIASMNFWGFKPTLFAELKTRFVTFLEQHGKELKSEFFIPFVVEELIAEKKASVRVLESEDSWFGVTYREDKPSVQANIKALIAAGDYPERIF
ncbi:MAG: nucleotidyltransferase [Lentisphaeria bacterium]|nr:nucleotidyltransferase [Lentisphaeria bacterium]